jgi:16S rRNA pseudouridine516 synthase
MRLDKYLADMGAGTRSEIKKQIKAGNVTVSGETVRDPGCQVDAGSEITLNGEKIMYEEFVYYMLNKPAGIISASEDSREETVVDLITERKRKDLFPAGRLDRDTEGLMLITNNGALAHRMLSPKHHVDKTYYAVIMGDVSDDAVKSFADGLVLPDGLECMPADLEILSKVTDDLYAAIENESLENSVMTEVNITIREGKFHQIKRMFEAIGCEVMYLKRLTMGTLTLDESLLPGEYRRLTDEEVDSLLKL